MSENPTYLINNNKNFSYNTEDSVNVIIEF